MRNVATWAGEIAAELGDGWFVPVREAHDHGAAIVHSDGRRLYAYVKNYGADAGQRAEFSGTYPRRDGVSFEPNDAPERIKVSLSRDPKNAARDLQRRFLGAYTVAYRQAVTQAQMHDNALSVREQNMRKLIEINPTDLREYRAGEISWSPDGPGFGRITVSTSGDVSMDLRSLTHAKALAVLRVLTSTD